MNPQMSPIEQQLCTQIVSLAVQAELCSINTVLSSPFPQPGSWLGTPLLLLGAGENWGCPLEVMINTNTKEDLFSWRQNYS